jgi:hypothetical protein
MTHPSAIGDVLQHSVAITNIQTAPRPFDIATRSHCFGVPETKFREVSS